MATLNEKNPGYLSTTGSVEIERAILGMMMNDSESLKGGVELLEEQEFESPTHRKIFRSLSQIHPDKLSFDLILFTDRLRDMGRLETVGGASYLTKVFGDTMPRSLFERYTQTLKEKSKKRKNTTFLGELLLQSKNGKSSGEILKKLRDFTDQTSEKIPQDEKKSSNPISADVLALMETEITEWHSFYGLDGVIGPGITTLISAHAKTGKSTYLVYVIRDLLSTLKVIWLTEEPRSIWKERLEEFPELQSPNLIFYFADGTKWTDQLKRLRNEEADILIIDTARNFCGIVDENDATAWNQAIWPLILIAREKSWALILLHHLRKTEAGIGLGHAGSHGLVGMVDLAIEIHRDNHSKNRRICRSVSRFIETPSEWMIEKKGDQLTLLGDPATVSLEELKGRVLEVLDKTHRTRQEITETLDPVPSRGALHKALKALVKEGKAEREGKGVRKDPFVFLRALGGGVMNESN